MKGMKMKQPPAHSASIESAMASLEAEFGIDEIEEVEEVQEIEELETSSTDDLTDLTEEIGKLEAYEEMAPAADVTMDAADVAEVVKKAKAPKAPKAAKAAKAPKVERDLTALPLETFVLVEGEAATEENRDAVIAMRPTQVKIADKFDRLFQSIAAGRRPDTFIAQALQIIQDAGSITGAGLKKAFEGKTTGKGEVYGAGTAASQAGQIMKLFPLLEMVTVAGKEVTFNPNSPVVKKVLALV